MTKTISEEPFSRRMTGTERRFLRMPNANVVLALRVDGAVAHDALAGALSWVRQRHPLLGVRVQLGAQSEGRFVSDNVPAIPVEKRPRASEDEWIAVIKQELARPFSPECGPLVRLLVLEAPAAFDLIVTAHHAICDGRSLVYLARDLLDRLGAGKDGAPPAPLRPVGIAEAMPASASGGFLPRLIIGLLNWRWRRKTIAFDQDQTLALHGRFWSANTPEVEHWALTPAQAEALATACRKEQVSVNEALYAAFLQAAGEVRGVSDSLRTVLVPIDLRDRLTQDVGHAVGHYASAIKAVLPALSPGASIWQTARDVRKTVREKLTDRQAFAAQRIDAVSPSLMDAIVFAKHGLCDDPMALRLLKRSGLDRRLTGVLLSNLGRMDIPQTYGSLELHDLIGPVVYSDGADLVLEVVTLAGVMHLTLSFGETTLSREAARDIRVKAMTRLAGAAGWPG